MKQVEGIVLSDTLVRREGEEEQEIRERGRFSQLFPDWLREREREGGEGKKEGRGGRGENEGGSVSYSTCYSSIHTFSRLCTHLVRTSNVLERTEIS